MAWCELTFVLWGLWHGAFLLLEEILPIKKLPKVFCHLYTLLVVCMGFVIFRADTITQGIQMIGKMFTGWDFSAGMINVAVSQMNPLFDLTVVLGVVGSIPLLESDQDAVGKSRRQGQGSNCPQAMREVLSCCCFVC